MKEIRIAQLKKWMEENPHEPFNKYALATEYLSINSEMSMKLFEDLLKNHENYTATYFHAAQLALEMGEILKAKTIFEKGLLICEAQKDEKAYKELKSAYQNFLIEYE
jgi:tetratricopeptide (TPR) repeat protein